MNAAFNLKESNEFSENKPFRNKLYSDISIFVSTVKVKLRALLILCVCVFSMHALASEAEHYVPAEIRSVYTETPYHFRNAKTYSVTFKTDPKALEGMLPDNFRPVLGYEDQVSIVVNVMGAPESFMGPYYETVIAVPAILATKDGDVEGRYLAQLYLGSIAPESNVAPTTAGQMFIGYPKREAIFQINGEFGGEQLDVHIQRYNAKIFDATFTLSSKALNIEDTSLQSTQTDFVLKAIQSVDEKGWDVLQVNTVTMGGKNGCIPSKLKEFKSAEANIRGDVVLDTGRVLPVKEVVGALYAVTDFCITGAQTLHDYLAE